MRMTYRISISLLIAVMIVGSLSLFAYSSMLNRPDVVLITIDALRADHLGCYGYKRNTSPNIDRLAKTGALFTEAITQAPYTAASIAAIFTASLPREHGISDVYERLDEKNITLAEILRNKGYTTRAITSNFIIAEKRGFEQGFGSSAFQGGESDEVPTAIKWIERNKNRPFFLWIHIMEPHAPYNPMQPYNQLYLRDKLYDEENNQLPIVADEYGFHGVPKYIEKEGIQDESYYIAQYDGEINSADHNVGMLLDTLKDLRLLDKTLLIVTADHGEELGEHGYYFSHGATLYDTALRVPLIIKFPHAKANSAIIDVQVRTIDLMPTILDIVGIKENNRREGVSLAPLIFKKDRLILDALSYTRNKVSLRTRDWKLIASLGDEAYELYNLKKDPDELTNLADSETEQFQILKFKLNNYINTAFPVIKKAKEPLDEATRNKLRSLGYAQ
jgi:choline-sulfatase